MSEWRTVGFVVVRVVVPWMRPRWVVLFRAGLPSVPWCLACIVPLSRVLLPIVGDAADGVIWLRSGG